MNRCAGDFDPILEKTKENEETVKKMQSFCKQFFYMYYLLGKMII